MTNQPEPSSGESRMEKFEDWSKKEFEDTDLISCGMRGAHLEAADHLLKFMEEWCKKGVMEGITIMRQGWFNDADDLLAAVQQYVKGERE